ncbi:hypothetical protein DL93DRAFT_2092383 [Clavulina sp. PMI_390]|nr:hypothetical protein DL93DRAFT_2092383 [Clavulina sp. PMI_390]
MEKNAVYDDLEPQASNSTRCSPIDLSHHFSDLAKARAPSPLKSILGMTPKMPGEYNSAILCADG